MSTIKPWKKRKRTGAVKIKLSKEYNKQRSKDSENLIHLSNCSQVPVSIKNEGSGHIDFVTNNHSSVHFMDSDSDLSKEIIEGRNSESFESNQDFYEDESENICMKNILFNYNIKEWAIKRNIAQDALKELATIVNNRFPDILPKDPRTILHTARKITIKLIESGGEYWHNGLINPLTIVLNKWLDVLENIESISLNINIDGLPIYKSSKYEFWPILCNVFEIPSAQPFIIGVYYGVGKPKNLDIYLEDFVVEMKQLLNDGIQLTSKIITVKIRCFICDSPARAFIKGMYSE